jgi:hypothetical protein
MPHGGETASAGSILMTRRAEERRELGRALSTHTPKGLWLDGLFQRQQPARAKLGGFAEKGGGPPARR